MTWRLKRTRQCDKCPWRIGTDPNTIPNGYSAKKHCALKSTIAIEGDVSGIFNGLRVMACHETHDAHCVGWLNYQISWGNNIALRMQMISCQNAEEIELRGPQHVRFEDTLPKKLREAR